MFNEKEDIGWQLSVSESVLELEVRQRALMLILVNNKLTTVEEINSTIEEVKKTQPYKTMYEEVQRAKKELEELEEIFL